MTSPAVATAEPGFSTEAWAAVNNLPCEVTVELALPDIRLSEVLEFGLGTVLETRWAAAADIPLRVNGEIIAWCEFEVVRDRLAVRLTELA